MSIKDFFANKAAAAAAQKRAPSTAEEPAGEPESRKRQRTTATATTAGDEIEEVAPSSSQTAAEGAEGAVRLATMHEMTAILANSAKGQGQGQGQGGAGTGTGPASIWQTAASGSRGSAELSSAAFDPSLLQQQQQAGKTGAGTLQYGLLSEGLRQIEETKHSGCGSKKRILVILTNVFRAVLFRHTQQELLASVYLLINRLAPDFENVEIGVGDQIVTRTMAEVYGRSEQAIKQDIVEGRAEDLGEAALLSRVNQKMLFQPAALTVSGVFKELQTIARASGKDSQRLKKDVIKKLLVAAKEQEAKFIIRTLQGRLRVGIQNASVLSALAFAFCLSSTTVADVRRSPAAMKASALVETQMAAMEAAVRQAFCEVPDYGHLLQVLLAASAAAAAAACDSSSSQVLVMAEFVLQRCQVRVGVPVKPMLAKPTKAITEVLDRFEGVLFTGEYKYDGERAQIHVNSGSCSQDSPGTSAADEESVSVQIYSRNSENMTEKYPDVVSIVKEVVRSSAGRIRNCIIDSEVVSFDLAEQKILPFQTLSTRSRKNVKEEDIKVQVCLFPFDLIFFNDASLVREPLRTRRSLLHTNFPQITNKFQFAVHRDMSTSEEIEVFLTEAVEHNCEGLMLKTLDANASYEPSKRSLNWLKLKKDYVQGMGDSVDLVPIGAFYGKGKRTGVYGAYLLACFDQENGEFQTTCKIGTGFSDEDLATHHAFLKQHVIPNKRADYDVNEKMYPDVWFDAVQVWEVAAADLSVSPVHTAGRAGADNGKGVGLRFPRFLRIRDDKSPEDATSAEQVLGMYTAQFKDKGAAQIEDDEEED